MRDSSCARPSVRAHASEITESTRLPSRRKGGRLFSVAAKAPIFSRSDRTATSLCCRVALARPEPDSNTTTRPTPTRSSPQLPDNNAIWARVAATGSIPCRSHTSRYSARPRADASIVRGARPRSTQICSHSRARSWRPNTGHFSSKITDTVNRASQLVVRPTDQQPTLGVIPRN